LPKKVVIKNKKASFEYFFIDTYEAGLKLVGTEVKALREGNANLSDAFCIFRDGNLEVHSMYIGEYKFGNLNNHETRRVRRLLLKKSELKKMLRKVEEKGNTIVPYKLYFNDRGFAKLEIALAKGKKSFDKRDQIKERDNKRELDRMKKITL
ncbi:UNVERIFIED_CONTAM: hypothetical protein GTU68_030459, partial [Idotea baltica]|nr:hypothetical protein [Idotea baltica]